MVNASQPTGIHWPLRVMPHVLLCSLFRIDYQNFDFTHCLEEHALHIYGYSGRVRLGPVQYDLRPGDITFTPAGMPSQYDLDKPGGQHWTIRFTLPHLDAVEPMEPAVDLPLHSSLQEHHNALVERCAQLSAKWSEGAHDAIAAAAGSAGFQELILNIVTLTRLAQGKGRSRHHAANVAERAANLIRQRFDEPLTVPQIAREVGVSQNYLACRFRERFGVTIPHYLITCRMGNARLLLASTELSIHAIAARVGMPDPRHFFKQFRRLSGKGPSAFRFGLTLEQSSGRRLGRVCQVIRRVSMSPHASRTPEAYSTGKECLAVREEEN